MQRDPKICWKSLQILLPKITKENKQNKVRPVNLTILRGSNFQTHV
uniref:Uncharacterized protein n=1 Tax=Rhizophora mucronata TaxID=61149 RepID=A0A2P2JW68_RHIMU